MLENTVISEFYNRHGGFSLAPFDSLNISFHVGDDEEAVLRNRSLIKKKMGIEFLISAKQVHGDNIYVVDSSPKEDLEVDGYDAIITHCKKVGLLIQQADCQGVLLFDSKKQVVAAVHCGWRGSVDSIISKTVKRMETEYSCKPAELHALISPSLGPCCAEFINYKEELPPIFHEFEVTDNHFDFWAISKMQLLDCGIRNDSISAVEICTKCNHDYFSFRRAKFKSTGITGRNCSVIALR